MAKQKKSKGRVVDFNKALEEKERKKREAERKQSGGDDVEISHVSEASVKRRKKKNRRRLGIYLLAIAIIAGIFGFLAHNIISLKMEQSKLEAKKEKLEEKKKELKEEKKAVNDSEYIEEQARQQLKMIKPGETLYLLPKDAKDKNSKKTKKNKQNKNDTDEQQ